jgi:putative membrane protein
MWVGRSRSWIRSVFFDGFVLPHVWGRTLAVTGLSLAMTIIYEVVPPLHYSVTTAPFTIIGLPLGVFLGFRNNSAYDRFWEGRKLWGALVNTARSLTRQILTLLHPVDAPPGGSKPEFLRTFEIGMVHLVIAFPHALRDHLRENDPFDALTQLLPPNEVERLRGEDNVPLAVVQRLGERLGEAYRAGWIHPQHVPILEASLVSLTDIQGACERIKSTPVPYSYTVLMHRIVAVYCAMLPFGLMETIGWTTPLVVLAISYCFFGLDAVGDEVEQPFGNDVNDLPLSAIARNIERNLRPRIGEPSPPSLAPVRDVLN